MISILLILSPERSQDVQQLPSSGLLDFCITLSKSGMGVEGSAADDERLGRSYVEQTERRLKRAGVRVGSR